MKKSEIYFSIALDENHVPEAISWRATDAGEKIHFAKAINIALWDREQPGTMKIDLWTKDMPVDEMKIFYHQTLVSMADSFQRATGDEKMADTMRDFCEYFAEKLELKQ